MNGFSLSLFIHQTGIGRARPDIQYQQGLFRAGGGESTHNGHAAFHTTDFNSGMKDFRQLFCQPLHMKLMGFDHGRDSHRLFHGYFPGKISKYFPGHDGVHRHDVFDKTVL
jgi:hypothetical protein